MKIAAEKIVSKLEDHEIEIIRKQYSLIGKYENMQAPESQYSSALCCSFCEKQLDQVKLIMKISDESVICNECIKACEKYIFASPTG